MTIAFSERIQAWDRRMLALAQHIAGWSKDPSTKVGAVIADIHHRVLSVGYNGFPTGVPDVALEDRTYKYNRIVHAELNAILFAQQPLVGAAIYVWPMPPCSHCAGAIIQAHIQKVVSPPAGERWEESCRIGREMFNQAGLYVKEIEI